jgi:hypothetical protein
VRWLERIYGKEKIRFEYDLIAGELQGCSGLAQQSLHDGVRTVSATVPADS